METVSPDVCASFEIKSTCKIDGNKNTSGTKYLLPSVKLPNKVPVFQMAIDIVSKKKSEKNADLYDFTYKGTIVAVNNLCSSTERAYFKYSSMQLGKFIRNKCLNRTKTFSQSTTALYLGLTDNLSILVDDYRLDISAIHSDYPYELCDQLLAGEMWPENKDLKLPDIEFMVSDVEVRAHRVIVCARSPVFAAMFGNEMLESHTGRVQICDVSVETFQLFLQFLYTGSLDESCFNEELKYCADKYQVTVLSNLCGGLLEQQDSEKYKVVARGAACKSDREKATYAKEPTIVEECFVIKFVLESARVGSNEFCFRDVVMEVLLRSDGSMSFFCWNPSAIGLTLLRVDCTRDGDTYYKPMKKQDYDSKSKSPIYGFPCFNAEGNFPAKCRIHFRVSFKEATDKYKFRLMDRLRGSQLLAAATDRQFTDVVFIVAGESFHVHRAIFAARCPEWVIREKNNQLEKYEVAYCDPSTFEQLLFFVYTGRLKGPADSEQLLLLAKKYGVSTLQEICELALMRSFRSDNEEQLMSAHL